MGGGKGSIDHYAITVKAGRVIIEVGGDCEYFEVHQHIGLTLFSEYFAYYSDTILNNRKKKNGKKSTYFSNNNHREKDMNEGNEQT